MPASTCYCERIVHIRARMHTCAHTQVMRERAQRGYVLDPDKNSEICGRLGQGELVRAWLQVAPLLPFERPCVHVCIAHCDAGQN